MTRSGLSARLDALEPMQRGEVRVLVEQLEEEGEAHREAIISEGRILRLLCEPDVPGVSTGL